MFISFVVIVSSISYIISIRQISDVENRIIEEKKIIGSFLSKEIEVGYFESKWPFESLKKLSKHKEVLFWWIVRDDGTIHLADNDSFMGTYAQDYFPQIASMLGKENISLNPNQNYGIFSTPLETGKKKWSFWYGFSLKEVSERRKEIIFLITVVSLSALVMLGVILYFAIRHFTKPIKELTVGAETIGKGHLTHRIKVVSKDELGQLSNSFNKMTEDLQRTTVSRDQLEGLVEKRTAEIRTANEQLQQEISERKRAEEKIQASLREKEVLLKEIHHRVKNNLQVISSLLNLQSKYIKDLESQEVFKESQNRVKSMALIHEKLYQSKDLGRINFVEYTQTLISNLFHSYGAGVNHVAFTIDADDIFLNIDTAIPCGLILSELVSNSLKHAFLGGRHGKIQIELRSNYDHLFALIVRDNGVGFPKNLNFRDTESLGLQLVNTLVNQLDGSIELDACEGTMFKIDFAEMKYKERG